MLGGLESCAMRLSAKLHFRPAVSRAALGRRADKPARWLAALLMTSLVVAQPGPASAASTVPSVTDPRYFAGANVPWFNWGCDFGCSTTNGVSSAGVHSALADGFARLKSANVHAVRWWVFEGDAWQINHDNSGTPTGLNPAVYTDMDAALALADQYDLAYDFVLFSGPTAIPNKWLTDPQQRQHLADTLAPLFARYKDNPRILAWELFNEPEWDIANNKIQLAPVQATVKLLTSTIHAETKNAVTIGSANLDGMSDWGGVGLDFYSPHWYDPMNSGSACAPCTDAATTGGAHGTGGAPIVLGEFYAGRDVNAAQRLKDFRAKGYAGAWAWSLFSDHTGDKMAIDPGAVSSFTSSLAPAPDAGAQPAGPVAGPDSAAPAGGGQAASGGSTSVQLLANWVSPTYVLPGQNVTVYQDLQTAADTDVRMQFDVVDANGHSVASAILDNQHVSQGAISSVSGAVALPNALPPGMYSVKSGAYSPDGQKLLVGSDVATLRVDALPPTPTPVPLPPDDNSSADT